MKTRTTVLGHVVRGGPPVASDRVLATQFGFQAMQLLMRGAFGRMVVSHKGELSDIDLLWAANKQRLVPRDPNYIVSEEE